MHRLQFLPDHKWEMRGVFWKLEFLFPRLFFCNVKLDLEQLILRCDRQLILLEIQPPFLKSPKLHLLNYAYTPFDKY